MSYTRRMDLSEGGTDSRVFWQLRRAFYAVEAEKERRLRPTGVTGPHYAVLMYVHLEEGISSAELARRLQVSPQNIAGLVAKLEDMGWVERRTHPRHRHVRELYLTEDGEAARRASDAVISGIEDEIARAVGDRGPEVRRALAALRQAFGDSDR